MDDDALYADLVTISALSVARVHPASRITILTDDATLGNCGNALRGMRNIAAEIRSVGSFAGDARVRSRFVKTQARSVLTGDFLYLDADTLPVSAFDDVFACEAPIAAAVDRNPVDPAGQFPAWLAPDFDRLDWPQPTKVYFNSGVVFWRDCESAHTLGRLWHHNWLHYATTVENPADQPAFNHSIDALGIKSEIMDDAFNFRVGLSPETAIASRIYHFYFGGENKPEGTIIDDLLEKYRANGEVDFSLIDDAATRGHAWSQESRSLSASS
jgi:hypothetical protein